MQTDKFINVQTPVLFGKTNAKYLYIDLTFEIDLDMTSNDIWTDKPKPRFENGEYIVVHFHVLTFLGHGIANKRKKKNDEPKSP